MSLLPWTGKETTKRQYKTFNYPDAAPGSKTLLTGIRQVEDCKHNSSSKSNPIVYITGFYELGNLTISFVYKGPINGGGAFHTLNFPNQPGATVKSTNLYGPNNGLKDNTITVVGNYTTFEQSGAIGCLYQGKLNGKGQWTTLIPSSLSSQPILNTIAHSNHSGLVVGNYDTTLIQGKAFIYEIATGRYYNIELPNAKSITAYGIWHNGCDSYTICGGFSPIGSSDTSKVSTAYLVDWDNRRKQFSRLRIYSYNNDPSINLITHFNGISGGKNGKYFLTGDFASLGKTGAFFAKVDKYGFATWSEVSYPNSNTTSGNSVLKNAVIGVYVVPNGNGQINGYVSA